jgi:hypothetical protein
MGPGARPDSLQSQAVGLGENKFPSSSGSAVDPCLQQGAGRELKNEGVLIQASKVERRWETDEMAVCVDT